MMRNFPNTSAGLKPSINDAAYKLQVALVLESAEQPAWLYSMVERVRELPFADICLVIYDRSEPSPKPHRRGSLWRLCQGLDKRLFGKGPDPLRPRDLGALLTDVPVYELGLRGAVSADATLAAKGLDVIIHLGWNRPHSALFDAARYGVWGHTFGTTKATAPGDVGLRELVEREPLAVTTLTRFTQDGCDQAIYSSYSRTIPFSPRKNRDNMYRKSAAFAARKLRDIYHGTEAATPKDEVPQKMVSDLKIMPRRHLNKLPPAARLGAEILRRTGQKLAYLDQWFVAYKFGVDPGLPTGFSGFTPMFPPKDRFWADPFPIQRDGRYFVFLEELMFETNKGHISVVELSEGGGRKAPVKVLEREYHMSYPFLFEWQGELFMLPETGHNRTVEVYRCHHFPDDWRLEKVLLKDVNCADATLAQIGDRWWMFVNISEEGTELYDELHLYHADQPFGEWIPHLSNPVKSDARSARPAGNLFWWLGELYRPAQCCVPLYGSALSINKVERINAGEFIEQEVAHFTADWRPGLLGLHTFNRAGGLSVIDGFKRTPRFEFSKSKLRTVETP